MYVFTKMFQAAASPKTVLASLTTMAICVGYFIRQEQLYAESIRKQEKFEETLKMMIENRNRSIERASHRPPHVGNQIRDKSCDNIR